MSNLTWAEVPKEFIAKVLAGGKITIPTELRTMTALNEGDTVILELKNIIRQEVKA
jgi:bifunctional DNA-binding transcriptional regulator/antitoxin component of YhaV-PrlF toxin-antitoxin module